MATGGPNASKSGNMAHQTVHPTRIRAPADFLAAVVPAAAHNPCAIISMIDTQHAIPLNFRRAVCYILHKSIEEWIEEQFFAGNGDLS